MSEEVLERALAHGDEHVVKLTDTARVRRAVDRYRTDALPRRSIVSACRSPN
jgi:hypothetical protein